MRQPMRRWWLAPSTSFVILVVAFQSSEQFANGLQSSDHEQSAAAVAAAPGAGLQQGGAMMSLSSDTNSALESAGVMNAEDLIAAESSQSPESASEQQHKAFTSAQMIRQDPQQHMSAVSEAPVFVAPQQQQAANQQQMYPQAPPHMAARLQPPHKANFNPFMAAALAGNYGPAQQQIAAAALHAQQQGGQVGPPPHHQQLPHSGGQHGHPHPHPHPHPHAQPQQQQQHHQQQHQQQQPPQQQQVAPVHQQQVPHHHHQYQPMGQAGPQQQQQLVHVAQPQQQHQMLPPPPQVQQQHQLAPAPAASSGGMVVQESSIRHNIVPAPPAIVAASSQFSAPEANTVELNEIPAAGAGQTTGLAVASSAQHPVIASATSGTGVGSSSGQESQAWPLQAPDIPKIVNLEVKCEKNLMKVSVEFDKIFNGVIFSKGHFNQGQCVHVGPQSNKQQAYFDISINSCGTQGNTQNGMYGMGQNTGSGTFFENTIVIQYDPNVQEVYDHARKLRCTWHDQYEKAVTFRPFPVDMLDIVRADFAGDNVGCWMQIQVGKGPWASEVAGIVKIGQTMTMVLAIKDEENKFDMLVRNCFAHDGKRGPIELVDKSGCITRPKLMSRFTKIKNFGSSATVLSYAHFQAFKFPDSMEVHFQCTIQICRHQCPDQCAAGPNVIGGASGSGSASSPSGESYSESTISGTFNIHSGGQGGAVATAPSDSVHLRKYGLPPLSRERRDTSASSTSTSDEPSSLHHHTNSLRWLNGSHYHHNSNQIKPLTQSVGVNRIIQVVSTGDLAFAVQQQQQQQPKDDDELIGNEPQASHLTRLDLTSNQICMSSYNFVLALVMLVLILLCSCMLAISLYVRQRSLLASGLGNKLSSASSASASSTSSSQSSRRSSTLNKLFAGQYQQQHQDMDSNHCHSPQQSSHHHVPSKQQLFAHNQFYANGQ